MPTRLRREGMAPCKEVDREPRSCQGAFYDLGCSPLKRCFLAKAHGLVDRADQLLLMGLLELEGKLGEGFLHALIRVAEVVSRTGVLVIRISMPGGRSLRTRRHQATRVQRSEQLPTAKQRAGAFTLS